MELYNRIAVGERIRKRRILLGLTQEELAEKVGRAYKYCQDIAVSYTHLIIHRFSTNHCQITLLHLPFRHLPA